MDADRVVALPEAGSLMGGLASLGANGNDVPGCRSMLVTAESDALNR
jgi:hypothetical protein